MQPGFSGAGSATAPRCPRRISPSGNTLVWFSSVIFSFLYSALWPLSGLKYIHQFSVFLARELMNISLLSEPSPPVLTREESGGMKKNLSCSSYVLLGAVRESGELDSLHFTPEVEMKDPVRPGGGDSIPCPIPPPSLLPHPSPQVLLRPGSLRVLQ